MPTAHQLSQSGSHLPLLATATGLLGGRSLDAQWTFLPFRRLIQAQPGASSCFLLTTTAPGNPGSQSCIFWSLCKGSGDGGPSPTPLFLSSKRKLSGQQRIWTWQESSTGPAVEGSRSSGFKRTPGRGHEAPDQRAPVCGTAENAAVLGSYGRPVLAQPSPCMLCIGGFGPWTFKG